MKGIILIDNYRIEIDKAVSMIVNYFQDIKKIDGVIVIPKKNTNASGEDVNETVYSMEITNTVSSQSKYEILDFCYTFYSRDDPSLVDDQNEAKEMASRGDYDGAYKKLLEAFTKFCVYTDPKTYERIDPNNNLDNADTIVYTPKKR